MTIPTKRISTCVVFCLVFGLPGVARAQGYQVPTAQYSSIPPVPPPSVWTTTGNFDMEQEAPNGIVVYTTLNIPAGVTVTILPNSSNTPLTIIAQDVIIDGVIDVSAEDGDLQRGGRGGPGGFPGGAPSPNSNVGGGAGLGPGGRPSGNPSHRTGALGYGSDLLVPILGGSGGAGASGGGGGGGGAIVIAADNRILFGSNGGIDVSGGSPGSGGYRGSDGAVRLIAPVIENRTQARGASIIEGFSRDGRVRIDTFDSVLAAGTDTPSHAVFGAWMTVDPFYLAPPSLEIIQVNGLGAAPGTTIGLASSAPATIPVLVRYSGFARDFTIEVVVTPQFNPSASATAEPVRVTRSVVLNPGTSSPNCGATTMGECVVDVASFPRNVPCDVAAYVRSF